MESGHVVQRSQEAPMLNATAIALNDIVRGVGAWRIWVTLGRTDVMSRYRRTRLGHFWVTATLGFLLIGIGIVYSSLFKQPLATFMPYLAINFVFWNLINGLVTEGCLSFIEAERFMKQIDVPYSTYVVRVIFRNGLMFAHNLVIIPIVFVIYSVPISPIAPLSILGLVLLVLNGLWVGLLLGTLAARFRDLPQLIQNLMQIAFFVTPVMFRPDALDEQVRGVIEWNPLASILAVVREPLLDKVPSFHDYAMAGGVLILGFAIALPFYGNFRRRIVYWV
jgi:ABC-type polysaccharide/polyol phosphate export permease